MKVKVDENLPVTVAALLRDRGVHADTVSDEGLIGASDATVFDATQGEDRLIITLDRGFGDVRRYPPGSHAGVVVLRLDSDGPRSAAAAVMLLLDHHDLRDLRGTITVMHRGTLRVRRPAD